MRIKKRHGGIDDLLSFAIIILTFLTVIVSAVWFVRLLDTKRTIDGIAREYLLVLETKAELSDTDVEDIKAKLEGMGFRNYTIVYNGNNTRVSYGKEVSIEITVNSNVNELGISTVGGIINDVQIFHTKLYSLAKR